jgi:hypothetical protein
MARGRQAGYAEGGSMTGFVLALAGLTCGDGGPGWRAAAAPVAVNPLAFEWEAELYWTGNPDPWRGRLFSCGLVYLLDGGFHSYVLSIDFLPYGVAKRGDGALGVFEWKGGRLVARFKDSRIDLRPAAPRSP